MTDSFGPAQAGTSQSPSRLWRGPRFVLASGSASRQALLKSAGLAFDVDPARLDERAVEDRFLAGGGAAAQLAACLAKAKAVEVSSRNPDALCLGADQTLTLGDRLLHKPNDAAGAERHLKALAGRTHQLTSAFCFAWNGEVLDEGVDVASLSMRLLDGAAIRLYLTLAGEAALRSVGAYQVESLGAHLFDKIEGDHTTILGLPLLPVLSWLRGQGFLSL